MRHIRINITLTPGDLQRLDDLAARTGKSRSQLIRDAVRTYRPDPGPEAVEQPDRETLKQWLRTVRIRLPADSTEMIRAMREGRREW